MERENLFYGYNEDYTYLDNAASTLSLKKVKEAVDEFLMTYGSIHRGSGYNSEISSKMYEMAREYILNLIDGTKEDCLIFTGNTTDSINKFVLLFPFKAGDSVLVSDIEHSSNLLPWLKHANVKTTKTKQFRVSADEIDEELRKDKTIKIVSISAASNITGYITDLESVYKVCQKHGVYLFVDASQYAPHRKPSLKYCDFIAYSGHKMYAPFGVGVLAGRKDVLSNTGMAITGGGNVTDLTKDNIPIYKEAPWLHEAGTPNGIGAIAISEAHRVLFEEIGEKALIAHDREMTEKIRECAEDVGENDRFTFHFCDTENRTPIMLLSTKDSGLIDILGKNNILSRAGKFCSYRLVEQIICKDETLIRLSAGLVNEKEDFDKVMEVIRE